MRLQHHRSIVVREVRWEVRREPSVDVKLLLRGLSQAFAEPARQIRALLWCAGYGLAPAASQISAAWVRLLTSSFCSNT